MNIRADRQNTLAVFLTKGISFKKLLERGLLHREIGYFNKMAENGIYDEIFIFSYGSKFDSKYIGKNFSVKVIPNSLCLPPLFYGLLMPFMHFRLLSKVKYVRTMQLRGFIPAFLSSLFFKNCFTIRCGYQLSVFLKNSKSYFKYILYSIIEFVLYHFADKIIVNTGRDKKHISRKYKVDDAKIMIIPNYINTEIFHPMDNIRKKEDEICYVGRLESQKNLFALFEAVKHTDARLKIIGSGSLRSRLENYARKLNIKVKFLGTVDNRQIPLELNKSGAFVLPSFIEGQPKVLLEAMACALPVIGSDSKGIKNIIENGENGLICGTDSKSIAGAVDTILKRKQLRERLGKKAREYVEKHHSLETALELEKRWINYL